MLLPQHQRHNIRGSAELNLVFGRNNRMMVGRIQGFCGSRPHRRFQRRAAANVGGCLRCTGRVLGLVLLMPVFGMQEEELRGVTLLVLANKQDRLANLIQAVFVGVAGLAKTSDRRTCQGP